MSDNNTNSAEVIKQVESMLEWGQRKFAYSSWFYYWIALFNTELKGNYSIGIRFADKADNKNPALDAEFALFQLRHEITTFGIQDKGTRQVLSYLEYTEVCLIV